jgi:eukaryotic-like serine/threonine-protein kinase
VPESQTQIGKYRIERELGRGAMGVVYRAFDPVVERSVAVKTIRLDVQDSEELLHRLKREAKSIGQLEHPNIVTLYEAGEWSGLFYLAMQFIQGETLQDRITRQQWFTLKEVQEILAQICAGLGYAHQRGVIHRDIKPANIMITREGTVKLTDFGIAKVAGTGTTSTGLVVGTPSYMSPEQALGKPLDGRSDIFSLGSILYELMSGEKAFPGQNVTTVMYKIVHEAPTPIAALQPGLDPAVEMIIQKALAKNPAERFQTCAELAQAFDNYISRVTAAMPGTAVMTPRSASVAPVVAAPPPSTPFPPVAAVPASVGGPVVTGTGPVAAYGTGAQPAQDSPRLPLAWLGGGIVGTLLLVIVIILVVQLRQPATAPQHGAPGVTNPAGEPEAQSSEPAKVSGPAAAQETPSEKSQPAVAESQTPQPATPAPALSVNTRQSRQTSSPREKTAVTPASEPLRPTPGRSSPKPTEPQTYNEALMQGDMAYQQGKYEAALRAYEKAYQFRSSSEMRRKLRTVLTLLGRQQEAAKYR